MENRPYLEELRTVLGPSYGIVLEDPQVKESYNKSLEILTFRVLAALARHERKVRAAHLDKHSGIIENIAVNVLEAASKHSSLIESIINIYQDTPSPLREIFGESKNLNRFGFGLYREREVTETSGYAKHGHSLIGRSGLEAACQETERVLTAGTAIPK
ncbi:MAG: hypothetical protein AABX04_01685 [Nanoarchaeota archaeon]